MAKPATRRSASSKLSTSTDRPRAGNVGGGEIYDNALYDHGGVLDIEHISSGKRPTADIRIGLLCTTMTEAHTHLSPGSGEFPYMELMHETGSHSTATSGGGLCASPGMRILKANLSF